MRKIFVCVCVAVVVLACLAPAVFASGIGQIQSPLVEPTPSSVSNADGVILDFAYVNGRSLHNGNPVLMICHLVLPVGSLALIQGGSGLNSSLFVTDRPVEYYYDRYDVVTGDYLDRGSQNFNTINKTIEGVTYHYGILNNINNTVNNGFYQSSDFFVIQTPGSSYFDIIWAPEVVPLNSYNSLMAEPVSDEYNRYFALVGSSQKYLFQVHFWVTEMITLQLTNPDQTTETYFNVKDLFAPVVRLKNNQLSLHYECIDPDMLDLLNATTQAVIHGLRIQITKYDFYTGQYIDSYLFTDFTVAGYKYDFQYNLGSYNDYDAVGIWGVYYDSFDSSYHYNKLACKWSYDQSFAEWQANTLRYLQLIYNVLSEQPEDEPTINDDMSAADEVHSVIDSLTPTDQYGNKVDTAQRVESELDRANLQIEDLREGVGTLNETMEGFLFLDPLFYVPLLVGLALGLVITILGKNKSG